MLRRVLTILLVFALFPVAAQAQGSLQRALSRAMAGAGPASGAYVIDATTHRAVFQWRQDTPRSLASNTKLFTSAAVLGLDGSDSTLATDLLGSGTLAADGHWQGDLYLLGCCHPPFASRSFAQRACGSAACV